MCEEDSFTYRLLIYLKKTYFTEVLYNQKLSSDSNDQKIQKFSKDKNFCLVHSHDATSKVTINFIGTFSINFIFIAR